LRCFPISPVRYPAPWSHVATVEESSNDAKPAWGPSSAEEYTFVECEYSPVRIEARLGQQEEFVTNAFEKFTP
jgi:hypothetical protein